MHSLITGTGNNDLDAIQDAARKFLNDLSQPVETGDNDEEENDDEEVDEEIENALDCLNRIHLQIGKRLEHNCLSSVELDSHPFYLYKCQFDDRIVYAMNESKERAKNIATSKMIGSLKSRLEVRRKMLLKKEEEILSQVAELEEILDSKIAKLESGRKRKRDECMDLDRPSKK